MPPPPPSFAEPALPPPPPADVYGSYGGEEDESYDDTAAVDFSPPDAPILVYDVPVIGSGAPPPPPMSIAPPPAPVIARPQWQQILDPASGAFYYENLRTGQSTWDEPSSFLPAPTGGSILTGANGASHEAKLKNTLDRYRQFVQDDEDNVKEVPDDEWD